MQAAMKASPLLLLLALIGSRGAAAMTFVTRSGNQLYADGRPFYHVGFNGVWMPSSVAFGLTARVDQTLDAAQAMGLKVVRVWGFNDAFPYAPGTYSDKQGRGLDYVIAAAGRRGIRVELALANFWNAYLSPEAWLMMAYGSAGSKNVADFYRSEKVLRLLEQHIVSIASRVNTLTGLAYKDDPTIIGYNLFNEPRCPGCTPEDMAARNAFIGSLANTLRAAAPKQLTFSGTEGFFAEGDPSVGFNPGHGTQCEGEDWSQEIGLFDVATTHMYWRQMESWKQTGYNRPGFDFYIQYLYRKLQLYSDLAANSSRPLVVEEFGLTKRFFNSEQIKVVVAVVADALIEAKRAGKPLMGAWLWQAAPIGDPDVGGYDVALTRNLSGATVGLGSIKRASATAAIDKASLQNIPEAWVQAGASLAADGSLRVNATGTAGSGSGPTKTASSNSSTYSSGNSTNSSGSSAFSSVSSGGSSGGNTAASGTTSVVPFPASGAVADSSRPTSSSSGRAAVVGRRRLRDTTGQLVVLAGDDVLGSFRRETQRMACAAAVRERGWPEQDIPFQLDVQAYLALVAKHDVVDILAEAARLLSQ